MCPSISHSSSAVCGANGDSITHQRVDRLAQHGNRLRRARPSRPAPRPRATARRARCRSLNAYSSLTSSISADTAVFRCMRSSMSTVTRRIVSCVLRRSARSASVQSSPHGRDAFAADRLAPVIDEPPDARRKRKLPSRPASLHSTSFSGGATNITYSRSASAPYFCEHVVGIDDVALRLRHDRAVLEHHALRQQPRERLVEVDQADVAEHAREEPRVEQVQDRVLDAAAVEVDRHPVRRRRRIERQLVVLRIAEAQEVPRRVDERVHRVGLAPRRPAALRTRHVDELRHLRQRRVAAAGERRRPSAARPAARRTGTGTTPSFSQ